MFWYNQSIETEKQSTEILEKCRNVNLNFKPETMLKNDQDQFQMIIQTCSMLQML